MNIWEIIILFFAFQAVLIGVFFLFKKREERYANSILSVLLLCFGFCIFYNTMFWSKLIFTRNFIHLNLWYLIPQSLIGPLFYFYIRSVATRKKISLKHDFWHFIPAIYILLSLLPYFILSGDEKVAVVKERRLSETIYLIRHTGVSLALLMAGYTVYAYLTYVKKYAEDIDLKIWLRAISLTFAGCVLTYLLYYLLSYAQVLTTEQDYVITAAMALCIGVTSYFGFHQPEVFNGKPVSDILPFIKYEKTGLSESAASAVKTSLVKIMEEEKPYLNSELRLGDLAILLRVSRHHASQVINEHFNVSFYDFINRYRIETAIELLKENQGAYNMKAIAYETGFNNYVSFYKAFKKNTGFAPTDFIAESSLKEV